MSIHTGPVRPRGDSGPAHPQPRVSGLSGGQALERGTQAEMSARFGHDFSQVRIHTDARAGAATEALGAAAFTVGQDIVFGAGQFSAGSSDTEHLLAHELTHVVQQSQWGLGDPSRMSNRSDASEREADALAGSAVRGEAVQVQARPGAALAREEDDGGGFWHSMLEGGAGLLYGGVQGMAPGGFLAPSPDPHSKTFETMRGIGQMLGGVADLGIGLGGEALGLGLDATGVGAIAGVPINVGSAVVAANGATSVVGGFGTLMHAMGMQGEGGGGGSGDGPGPGTSAQRSIRSLEARRAEHIQKLEEYKANPDAFDNQGFLKNAPSPEIRQQIIDGRIRHLQNEIDNFTQQIEQLQKGT